MSVANSKSLNSRTFGCNSKEPSLKQHACSFVLPSDSVANPKSLVKHPEVVPSAENGPHDR